ncbi:MAG: leucine-rich repeat domain-containing protein [Ruminococcaceae bacterium]|nr:leucine-rich repeat domain-containing protein [Oscillospiraceae bacterium]
MRKTILKDNMRRLILILTMTALMISLFVPFVSAAEISGTCGNNLTWTLSETGILTVSGTGDMPVYSELYPAPWYVHREQIRSIVVEEGVTSIGNRAFRGLENAVSVTLPSTLKTIGNYAFVQCSKLKMVSIREGLETIREGAFENCEALIEVRLPNTLKTLGRKAFYHCSSLKTVDIPASVTSFGDLVFSYCENLITANIKASVEELPIWTFYGCELLTSVYFSDSIIRIGEDAFENCTSFYKVNYGGSQEKGSFVLPELARQSGKRVSEYVIYYDALPFVTGQTSSAYSDDQFIVTNQNTVTKNENSTISTTVTKTTEYTIHNGNIVYGDSQVNIKIDAVLENENGWNELISAVRDGEQQNVDLNEIQVDVTMKDSSEIAEDTLNQFVGKDEVNLNIDMEDGSSVKIDCGRLEYTQQEETKKPISLKYNIIQNVNPTKQHVKTIGDAQSYLLSFEGSLEMDFSPKIYLGKVHSYKTASLYQYIPGRGLSLLQSVFVDKSGYATYYLGSTKDTTQYLIALDVKGVDSSTAIVPEDIAKDQGELVYYEPIEYVVTGVRMFMGLSFFQFTVAVFCVMLVLFVGVGITMSVIYRKKKMEAYYKMLQNEEDDGFI